MRFKRGSKVEVFSTKEVPSGSWYAAEIIHGNGHCYTVKYDGENFDRVPRKAIRPCPPVVQVLEDWAFGQVAEVFHCFSWKMATVLRVLQRDWLLVRLIGSSYELEVRKVDVRPRLCWQDDKWKVIGKGSSKCEERRDVPLKPINHSSQHMETPASICFKNSCLPFSNVNSNHETPCQSLKRKLTNCQSQSTSYALPSQKIRVIEKDSRRIQFISMHHSQLPEKIDAIASSRAMVVEKCTPSYHNRLTGFSRLFVGREKVDGAVGCSRAISLELKGADSIVSSVASCSIFRKNISTGSFEDSEYSSDAESFCRMEPGEGNSLLPTDENFTEEIHRIELHAYRRTIEALHASGPLSWEQETLLTDLRDSLHITNDEHLMEGQRWRLIHLASKCLKMILGSIFNLFIHVKYGTVDLTFSANLIDVNELLPLAIGCGYCILPLEAS